MNKEEIAKLLKINETIITSEQCKEHRTLRNDERTLLMNNIKIKEYIQELEGEIETYKDFKEIANMKMGDRNVIRAIKNYKTLDKVKDKLKEKIEIIETTIELCERDGKIAKYKIKQLKEEHKDLQEILKIIGEKE